MSQGRELVSLNKCVLFLTGNYDSEFSFILSFLKIPDDCTTAVSLTRR